MLNFFSLYLSLFPTSHQLPQLKGDRSWIELIITNVCRDLGFQLLTTTNNSKFIQPILEKNHLKKRKIVNQLISQLNETNKTFTSKTILHKQKKKKKEIEIEKETETETETETEKDKDKDKDKEKQKQKQINSIFGINFCHLLHKSSLINTNKQIKINDPKFEKKKKERKEKNKLKNEKQRENEKEIEIEIEQENFEPQEKMFDPRQFEKKKKEIVDEKLLSQAQTLVKQVKELDPRSLTHTTETSNDYLFSTESNQMPFETLNPYSTNLNLGFGMGFGGGNDSMNDLNQKPQGGWGRQAITKLIDLIISIPSEQLESIVETLKLDEINENTCLKFVEEFFSPNRVGVTRATIVTKYILLPRIEKLEKMANRQLLKIITKIAETQPRAILDGCLLLIIRSAFLKKKKWTRPQLEPMKKIISTYFRPQNNKELLQEILEHTLNVRSRWDDIWLNIIFLLFTNKKLQKIINHSDSGLLRLFVRVLSLQIENEQQNKILFNILINFIQCYLKFIPDQIETIKQFFSSFDSMYQRILVQNINSIQK
ncbi:fanconi anemia group e protein [Anaeramoeba flamelloides]|uniref:Fanconi anemia group e protein n=1 Tax=Anaeramoeba flamelloides TaxID=1746091 RepID=A0ABQ8X492_9EUKA|nr:fanconi anemia group e protein [Anaeramoeba flamelloides]